MDRDSAPRWAASQYPRARSRATTSACRSGVHGHGSTPTRQAPHPKMQTACAPVSLSVDVLKVVSLLVLFDIDRGSRGDVHCLPNAVELRLLWRHGPPPGLRH